MSAAARTGGQAAQPDGTPHLRQLGVLVVGGDAVTRIGLRALLATDRHLTAAGEAIAGPTAVSTARQQRPDVILLDKGASQGKGGLNLLPALTPLARVLVLTRTLDPAVIVSFVRDGASGCLVHGDFTPDELLRAVLHAGPEALRLSPLAAAAMARYLHDGSGVPHQRQRTTPPDTLTRRERQVMELVTQGLSNVQIAAALSLKEKTVKNHINHIFGKLHAGSRAEAMAHWLGTARPRVTADSAHPHTSARPRPPAPAYERTTT
ncbi:LuxR C-terminal-related transcriptional regulator [Streptomyces mirabilis]|uniref:LuxR C-terminal-related transcriptional regulator n=1 Tax=Streptomyces mirabilis TaxID=68239 RepID=UPI00380D8EC0